MPTDFTNTDYTKIAEELGIDVPPPSGKALKELWQRKTDVLKDILLQRAGIQIEGSLSEELLAKAFIKAGQVKDDKSATERVEQYKKDANYIIDRRLRIAHIENNFPYVPNSGTKAGIQSSELSQKIRSQVSEGGGGLFVVHLPNDTDVVISAGQYLGTIYEGVYSGFAGTGTGLSIFGVDNLIPDITHGPLIGSYPSTDSSNRELSEHVGKYVYPHVANILEGKEPLKFTMIASHQDLEAAYEGRRTTHAMGVLLSRAAEGMSRGRGGERTNPSPLKDGWSGNG